MLDKGIIRDAKHRKFINSLPCCSCFNNPLSECSHIRRNHDGGTSIKPSDNLSVPQCHRCHDKVDYIITRENTDDFKTLAKSLYQVSGDWKQGVKLVLDFRRKYATRKIHNQE